MLHCYIDMSSLHHHRMEYIDTESRHEMNTNRYFSSPLPSPFFRHRRHHILHYAVVTSFRIHAASFQRAIIAATGFPFFFLRDHIADYDEISPPILR